jgi:hypothetical protein
VTPASSASVILSGARSAQSKDPRISHPHYDPLSLSAVILSGAKDPCISFGSPHRWLLLAAFLLFCLLAAPAHAQGCAQCLDSTRATPPAVQAAYRHAIYLLGGFAVTLFLTALVLFRRQSIRRP